MKVIDIYRFENNRGILKCEKCGEIANWTIIGKEKGKKVYKRLCDAHYMNK